MSPISTQSAFTFAITDDGRNQFVTIFADGIDPTPKSSAEPNFKALVALCAAEVAEPGTVSLDQVNEAMNVGKAVERAFERLSLRVTVVDGEVLFDGDAAQPFLSEQIIRMLDAGEDVQPLVAFMEKVQNNPSQSSRAQLYTFLNANAFTITDEGLIVGYKGVESDGKGGYQSVHQGPGNFVDGVPVDGKVPNNPGTLVEMKRSDVAENPGVSCSRGLHVATHSYASTWGRNGAVMEVHVDPRDVVSVPNHESEKVRVCRYFVVGPVEKAYDGPILPKGKTADEVTTVGKRLDLGLPNQASRGSRSTERHERREDAAGAKGGATYEGRAKAKDIIVPASADDNTPLSEGDRVIDVDGDQGTVVPYRGQRRGGNASGLGVAYDDDGIGTLGLSEGDVRKPNTGGNYTRTGRKHGKGGATSQSAKGNGLNPAQDPRTGRFVGGRPGSTRDKSTGRFA